MSDLTAQLEMQQQLNDVLLARQEILKEQVGSLKEISNALLQAAKAADNFGETDKAKKVAKDLKMVQQEVKSTKDLWGELKTQIRAKFKDRLPLLGAITGGLVGLKKAGSGLLTDFKSIGSVIKNLVGTVFNLGKSLLMLPFKILNGLVGMSQRGGISPVRQEIEKIREQFGLLTSNEGKAAISSLKQFRKQSSDLAGTGLSLARAFGRGREGVAAAMQYNKETMEALGPALNSVMGSFEESAVELSVYRKGLGLSADQMAGFIKRSVKLGEDPVEGLRRISSMSIQMGEQFGISNKVLSRSMAEMSKDVENFGTLSVKELGAAATYAAKLGVEIQDLQGLIGQFDDFENAAQNASKLAQAFGMNVDAMKMMNAQNPAERLSMLQKAFAATGRSVKDMTRQELSLLSAQTGLSAEATKRAFSNEGLSMSYDEIKNAAEENEKSQLTQEQVMLKLADAIERVLQAGNNFTSFLQAFMDGLSKGVLYQKDFMRLLMNIRSALWKMYYAGKAVGKAFIEMFPGIQKMVTTLADFFDPSNFAGLTNGIVDVFKQFFEDLRSDPKAGFETFIENIKKLFEDTLGGSGELVDRFLEGGKEFIDAAIGIFEGFAVVAGEGIIKALNYITDFLENPPGMSEGVKSMLNRLGEALSGLGAILLERGLPLLKDALSGLFSALSPYIKKALPYILIPVLTKAFLTVIMGSIIGAASGAILQTGALILGKALLAVSTKALAATAGSSALAKAAQALGTKLIASTASAAAAPAALSSISGVVVAGSTIPPAPPPAQLLTLKPFLAAVGVVIGAFGALVLIYKLAKLKPSDALAIAGVMVAIAGSTATMAFAMTLIPPGAEAAAARMKTLTLFIVALSAAAIVIFGALSIVPDIPLGKVLSFAALMTTISLVSIPLLVAAAAAGLLAKSLGPALSTGLPILGIALFGLGIIGVAIGALIEKGINDPASVAVFMGALSSIMTTVMLMLPVAALLGTMLMAAPFGTAGVAAMVIGFGVLAGLAGAMIASLMPALRDLAKIDIPNPSAFKAVTGALVDIIGAVSKFVKALAVLAFILKPSPLSNDNTETFKKNTKAFEGIVESILNSGIKKIIDDLVDFAKTTKVTSGTADAIKAISGILSATASLMQALSPGDKAYDAVIEAANTWGEDSVRTTNAVSRAIMSSGDTMVTVMGAIADNIPVIIDAVKGVPPEVGKAAPIIEAVGAILSSVGSMLSSMSPSSGAWDAVKEATDTWGESGTEMVQKIFEEQKAIFEKVLPTVFRQLGKTFKAIGPDMLEPIIEAVGDTDPEVLKGLGSIMSATFSVVGELFSVLPPVINTLVDAIKGEEESLEIDQVVGIVDTITGAMQKFAPAINAMTEPLKGMVASFVTIAQGIKDPKKLASQAEAVGKIIEAANNMISTFSGDAMSGGLSSVLGTDKVSTMKENINAVTDNLLKRGGPIERLASGVAGIRFNSETATRKVEALTKIADGFAQLTQSMKKIENDPNLRLAVDVGKSLAGNGSVTVKHENVKVNVHVNIKIDSEDFAKGTIESLGKVNKNQKYKTFVAV